MPLLLLLASLSQAAFPPCVPQPGWAWCAVSPDPFLDGLPADAKEQLGAALHDFLAKDVLGELAERVGEDPQSKLAVEEMRRRTAQARNRLWKEIIRGGIVSVQDFGGEVMVEAHLRLEPLFGEELLAGIRERHQGLGCDASLIVFLDRSGRLLRVNPYMGSCHDAHD